MCIFSSECETKSNGFIDGVEGQVTMGEQSSVKFLIKLIRLGLNLIMKHLKHLAEGAEMRFADGRVGVGLMNLLR